MVHLETKETHSCTSTNPIRTLEKKGPAEGSDNLSFIRLEASWLLCTALLHQLETASILWSNFDHDFDFEQRMN
jgi:hypothetical protein